MGCADSVVSDLTAQRLSGVSQQFVANLVATYPHFRGGDGITTDGEWQTAYVRIPIACTLTPEAAIDRISQWQRFLAHSTDAVERADGQRLRFRLNGSARVLANAVDLARREKFCCPFFEFSIEIEEESSWLTIEVPPDPTKVLADFASLLSRGW